jgi:hypothetical protein
LKVDEIEQLLVKLNLKIGVLVALGEGACIANSNEPVLFLCGSFRLVR